ncbi:hypothetical protein CALVIDRAFT_127837 [Calocera viscosa TUFC12733]|uniref:Uncharacterized protein n=1 Tax=Calocera viscosa (strain TUFC12733) TaxID=1330018 RepID=A0A167RSN5_CALVF|nr:hypothetical protein CALVIDRAFT_127837 [Calocera viscosa TUFC12733]
MGCTRGAPARWHSLLPPRTQRAAHTVSEQPCSSSSLARSSGTSTACKPAAGVLYQHCYLTTIVVVIVASAAAFLRPKTRSALGATARRTALSLSSLQPPQTNSPYTQHPSTPAHSTRRMSLPFPAPPAPIRQPPDLPTSDPSLATELMPAPPPLSYALPSSSSSSHHPAARLPILTRTGANRYLPAVDLGTTYTGHAGAGGGSLDLPPAGEAGEQNKPKRSTRGAALG